ncbi:MAG: DUF2946 family protein [Pseudomonadaceae bacterium]|jgi:hypothetical protein|nr:DUF2946 family protein [Pseudomonadaceae bacterium]
MQIALTQRRLMAWLLYGCVLFSTFACAIGHGQSSGLQLSGIAQLQCSISGATDSRVPPLSNLSSSFSCPLCASHGLTSALSGYRLQLPAWQPSPAPSRWVWHALPAITGWLPASPRAPPIAA